MKNDSLGDRIKNNYEGRSQTYLPRRTYTVLRLDGKAFHTYTRNCKRPYDLELMEDMDNTAKYLCENIQGCKLAYVQSDEISLVLTDFDNINTDAWFDGNVQKITSISASMAAAKFNQLRTRRNLNPTGDDTPFVCDDDIKNLQIACFDSRCFVIPDVVEVHNYFLWRQQDATRNSIQMTGQAHFSHKELQNKSCDDIQEMLWAKKNINWNDMPVGFKRGRCVVKEYYEAPKVYAMLMTPNEEEFGSYEIRSRWTIVEPPVFSQEPNWILNHVNPIK
jgi:tRNA(His) 5'-end guanylyltransferase